MASVKMIILDLDGTLLRSDKTISEQSLNKQPEENLVYRCGMDLQTTNQLIRLIQAANAQAEITVAVGKKVYWNSLHIAESEKLYKAIYCDYQKPLTEAACKIAASLPDRKTAQNIADTCRLRLISYRDENFYAFIAPAAGKLQAIRALASSLGISLRKTAAFGDDENDLDMLEACGKGIAVANALESVKNAADEICGDNDSDGVAMWLEENVIVS